MAINRRQFFVSLSSAFGVYVGERFIRYCEKGDRFRELKAKGSAGHIGFAHGKEFKSLVQENLGFYLSWLGKATGKNERFLLYLAKEFVKPLREYFPWVLEEINGIAKGSGRKLEEILLINARTDLFTIGRRKEKDDKPECTAVALKEKINGKDLIALGQTWDWNKKFLKTAVILRLEPKDKPSLITFTEAGMVGKIGFNEERLGVCLNFLSHKTDNPQNPPGIPVHCLLRLCMGCSSVSEAIGLVSGSPRCASANFLLASYNKKGASAIDLEFTSTATSIIHMKNGVLTHANHFKNKVFGSKRKARGTSLQRDESAQRLGITLKKKIPDPAARLKKILSSASKDAGPISRKNNTVAGIVMDLSRNKLHVVKGPPHLGKWYLLPGV